MNEREAQERTWEVVRRAFEAHEPRPHKRDLRPLAVVLVAGAIVAAAVSPPGQALLGDIGDAVGVEKTEPAIFSLPAPGRLLVVSSTESWVVNADGSRRKLGDHTDAAWSPFGRFVVATHPNEVAALRPDGEERWTIARRDVRLPAWGGTRTDTRVAYLTGSRLHVVAGDGTGDVDAGGLPAALPVRPAWRPGGTHEVAYVDVRRRVTVYDADAGSVSWRSAPLVRPVALEWSRDGRVLLAAGARQIRLHAPTGRVVTRLAVDGVAVDAAFAPRTKLIAVLTTDGRVVAGNRTVFAADGLGQLEWSHDGRWLLVTWPAADQWVFVRIDGRKRVQAVAGVAAQFGGEARVVSWGPPEPEDS